MNSGYTPVFGSIYQGTLCGKWPDAAVWASILPLCDRHGHIDYTPVAIAALTGWPLDLLNTGLAGLASPDAGSRSQLEGGRRIAPLVDTKGWRIVGWPRTVEFDCRPIALRLPVHEWRVVRQTVFQRDNFTCAYCGQRGGQLECDHIMPVSRGGGHDLENLATACLRCNRSKRASLVSEWVRA